MKNIAAFKPLVLKAVKQTQLAVGDGTLPFAICADANRISFQGTGERAF
jgi:hypothetical protein